MSQPKMSVKEINAFLEREFPQMQAGGRAFFIDGVEPGAAAVRLKPTDAHLRPGGTVSGPTLFALADFAAYVVILAHIGPIALAVTTNLTINFLVRPEPGDLVCRTRLLKLGKRLAVVDCQIHASASDRLVAQATATYSIPPERQ